MRKTYCVRGRSAAGQAAAFDLRRAARVDRATGVIARLRRDAVAADEREGFVLGRKTPPQRESQEGSYERARGHDGQDLRAGRRREKDGARGEGRIVRSAERKGEKNLPSRMRNPPPSARAS